MDKETMKIVYAEIDQRIRAIEGALKAEENLWVSRLHSSKLKAFNKLKWRLQDLEKESRRLR